MLSMKLVLKPKSAFATPLHSDTLWGHFLCSFSEIYGTEKLDGIIEKAEEKHFLGFSDAFPAGMLPKPLIEPQMMPDTIEFIDQKKITKEKLILKEDLMEIRRSLSFNKLVSIIEGQIKASREEKYKHNKKRTRTRVAIDRHTGRGEKGALFEIDETWYEIDSRLELYCKIDESIISEEELVRVLDYIGDTGYGKDSSVGLGRFKVEDILRTPEEMREIENADIFMSLSHGFPGRSSALYYGKTITKFGKHGGKWATNGIHFKNPVILYNPGSTFKIKTNQKLYGRVFNNVSANPGNHFLGALMVPLFIKTEQER